MSGKAEASKERTEQWCLAIHWILQCQLEPENGWETKAWWCRQEVKSVQPSRNLAVVSVDAPLSINKYWYINATMSLRVVELNQIWKGPNLNLNQKLFLCFNSIANLTTGLIKRLKTYHSQRDVGFYEFNAKLKIWGPW